MSARVDLLDQHEPLSKPLVGSVVLHVAVTAILVGGNLFSSKPDQWGDPHGGGIGSVTVNPVQTIPLPAQSGPKNPVANDSQFQVPEPPAKSKPQPKTKPSPDPSAVQLKGRATPKKQPRETWSPPNKWRDQQQYPSNQAYSSVGQQVNTPLFGMQGGGGVGVGTNSPFGTQLGWYAKLLSEAVARKWNTGDIDARISSAPPAIVVFTLRRDGSVTPGSAKIKQSSGNRALDYSALRAIEDAAPFQAIPAQFPRNEAEIEFQFVLRR
jgi:protein TonB